MDYSVIGTILHVFTLAILLWKVHKTRSLHGISSKTQLLFAIVYTARSYDLICEYNSYWERTVQLFSVAVPYISCYLIYDKFKATHNHNYDTFRIDILLIPAAILAIYFNCYPTPVLILWVFSIYLESIAILPQLYMIIKAGEVEQMTLYYLYALGVYSIAYIPNFPYMISYFSLYHIVPRAVQISIYCAFFGYKCNTSIKTYTDIAQDDDASEKNNKPQLNGEDGNRNRPNNEEITNAFYESKFTGSDIYLNINDLKNNVNNVKFNKMVHEESSITKLN